MLCRFICHARFRENCRPIVMPMTVTCPYAALSVSHRPSVPCLWFTLIGKVITDFV